MLPTRSTSGGIVALALQVLERQRSFIHSCSAVWRERDVVWTSGRF